MFDLPGISPADGICRSTWQVRLALTRCIRIEVGMGMPGPWWVSWCDDQIVWTHGLLWRINTYDIRNHKIWENSRVSLRLTHIQWYFMMIFNHNVYSFVAHSDVGVRWVSGHVLRRHLISPSKPPVFQLFFSNSMQFFNNFFHQFPTSFFPHHGFPKDPRWIFPPKTPWTSLTFLVVAGYRRGTLRLSRLITGLRHGFWVQDWGEFSESPQMTFLSNQWNSGLKNTHMPYDRR